MPASGPLQSTISAWIRTLFQGNPFGQVYRPPATPPVPPAIDGRTAALRILRRYISELIFYRSGDLISPPTESSDAVYGTPIPFQLPLDQVFAEQNDNDNTVHMPTIAVIPSDGQYLPIGLTSFLVEDTRDVYGKGTVVQWQSEYQEDIGLEVMAGSKAERRAIVLGLEQALSPTEQWAGIRFKMPSYYDQLVCFELQKRRLDEIDSGRNHRKAMLTVTMRYTVCALVDYVPLQPQVTTVFVDDPTIELDEEVPP